MIKYYNKDAFNSGLDDIVGEVHLTIKATHYNNDNIYLEIGLANKEGLVYVFEPVILNSGDRIDILSDNIKSNIIDWVQYG